MNDWQLAPLMAGLTVGLAFGGGVVALWAERRRRAWRSFAQRAEQARQHLLQQNTQARKQVELVQAELNAARHLLAVHSAQTGQSRFPDGAATPGRTEPAGPVIGYLQTDLERSADGFASTQVVWRAH
ncbi:hypothetical protein [Inhella gelatinilytica]|uniref:Uncharacterized protein n=1 Tax=Inhella gelatinilytica TaxID=2795030 RepID=A0A931IW89_9BURK|nr:hypothetical protein [Inhella gelatinilytica]MBH9552716.1 hypothetical protein [Inhella gelatinilytica]